MFDWRVSEYASTEKQGWCEVCKKTPRRLYLKYNIIILYVYIIYFLLFVLKYLNDIS